MLLHFKVIAALFYSNNLNKITPTAFSFSFYKQTVFVFARKKCLIIQFDSAALGGAGERVTGRSSSRQELWLVSQIHKILLYAWFEIRKI